MKTHKNLLIQDAVPGLIIAHDLLDENGHVLLPDATVLTQILILSLKKRGVAHIVVHAMDEPDEEKLQDYRRKLERLGKLFRKTGNSPVNKLLIEFLAEYHQEKR